MFNKGLPLPFIRSVVAVDEVDFVAVAGTSYAAVVVVLLLRLLGL